MVGRFDFGLADHLCSKSSGSISLAGGLWKERPAIPIKTPHNPDVFCLDTHWIGV